MSPCAQVIHQALGSASCYPTPGSVTMYRGCAWSGSSFRCSRLMNQILEHAHGQAPEHAGRIKHLRLGVGLARDLLGDRVDKPRSIWPR